MNEVRDNFLRQGVSDGFKWPNSMNVLLTNRKSAPADFTKRNFKDHLNSYAEWFTFT
jgi:hypothetical protein